MRAAQYASAARTRLWLDLPARGGAAALKGALIAMGLIPQPLPTEPTQRRQALASLDDGALAFLDVASPGLHGRQPLEALLRDLPDMQARGRVMLGRARGGHVCPQDRRWMMHLGLAELLPDWLGGTDQQALRAVLAWVARMTGLDEPEPQQLATHARVLTGGNGGDAVPARALVWRLAGQSPEDLAARLVSLLDHADRRWKFSRYPRCFVGSQAVDTLMSALRLPRGDVLALGQALGELGLLCHVVQEHPFLDQDLFYRLAWSAALDRVDATELWRSVEGGLPALTATRSYLGTSYAACFLGAELVTLLAQRHALHRVDAWLAVHRMAQWGWVEHVTRARPFIDGPFFYRWKDASLGPLGPASGITPPPAP
jgi:hypothetical protein